ncbi:hypothetical protein N7456_010206 [Penicillium angulare]|uniref:AB hydrolase-1 domain-containing protein n=1 Tax=Penicillium angulare TaxID=116970 RepID=A0A9W9F6A8_9EURO|nr:hypothetical protein N7456_010206 [Penicillium angulare]
MALYHQTVDFLSDSWANRQTQLPLLAVTGASFTIGLLLRSLLSREPEKPPNSVLPSPRTRILTSLSEEENRQLPLPNDVLPGARDVDSPYGSIRVYEWGREDGPKVLMVHGITTPCIALGGLAHALVDRGCRVIVFDLFGRGFSDTPSDLPQDMRLYTTQIMLALTSSPVSWTGADSGKFSLVGYSLGGGIAAAFASYFPNLLSSLVLLAPAGMLHDSHVSFQARLLYATNLIPDNVLEYFVGKRLRAGPLIAAKPKPKNEKLHMRDAITEELPTEVTADAEVLSREYPHLNVPSAIVWQVDNHSGFVHAFMSTMRNGPIFRRTQWKNWARLGEYLSAQNSDPSESLKGQGLPSHKVHILCGNSDAVIMKDDLVTDATAALGGNAVFKFYDAGHEFPSTKYEEVASYISKLL